MPKQVVVLGAGFGGLELVTRLSESVPDEVHVTLIDKNDSFMFGFSKLDIMFGRSDASDVWHPYRDIAKPGVEFRQETVTSIDPVRRRVATDAATYDADILVVALGADYDTMATPGLVEDGYEFYSAAGAERACDALAGFSGGAVVVAVLQVPRSTQRDRTTGARLPLPAWTARILEHPPRQPDADAHSHLEENVRRDREDPRGTRNRVLAVVHGQPA
jgi:sulfide:quinone oxidoreductase